MMVSTCPSVTNSTTPCLRSTSITCPLVLCAFGRVPAVSAAHVASVVVPDAGRPAVFCSAHSACVVSTPNFPSAGPFQ